LDTVFLHFCTRGTLDKLPIDEASRREDGLNVGFFEATFTDHGWTLEGCMGLFFMGVGVSMLVITVAMFMSMSKGGGLLKDGGIVCHQVCYEEFTCPWL